MMLLVLSFITMNGEVALENVSLDRATVISVEYSFQDTCTLELQFMKGYDVYGISRKIAKTSGVVEFHTEEARLIPTRRKPRPMPPILIGNCRGRIEGIEVR